MPNNPLDDDLDLANSLDRANEWHAAQDAKLSENAFLNDWAQGLLISAQDGYDDGFRDFTTWWRYMLGECDELRSMNRSSNFHTLATLGYIRSMAIAAWTYVTARTTN
jgi:hypothetical protein